MDDPREATTRGLCREAVADLVRAGTCRGNPVTSWAGAPADTCFRSSAPKTRQASRSIGLLLACSFRSDGLGEQAAARSVACVGARGDRRRSPDPGPVLREHRSHSVDRCRSHESCASAPLSAWCVVDPACPCAGQRQIAPFCLASDRSGRRVCRAGRYDPADVLSGSSSRRTRRSLPVLSGVGALNPPAHPQSHGSKAPARQRLPLWRCVNSPGAGAHDSPPPRPARRREPHRRTSACLGKTRAGQWAERLASWLAQCAILGCA